MDNENESPPAQKTIAIIEPLTGILTGYQDIDADQFDPASHIEVPERDLEIGRYRLVDGSFQPIQKHEVKA